MSELNLDSLENAIANFEGFNTPGSVAQRNNNPGNLQFAPWETGYGGTATPSGFAQFPDTQSGYDALDARVTQLVQNGSTLSDLVHTWSGAQYPGNSPASESNYVSSLSQQTGIDANVPLNTLSLSTGTDSNSAAATVASSLNPLAGIAAKVSATLSPGRLVTTIVGLLCILGALFLFTGETIASGVSSATERVSDAGTGIKTAAGKVAALAA